MINVKTVSNGKEVVMYFYKTKDDFPNGDSVEEVQSNTLGMSIDYFRCPLKQSDLHPKYPADAVESVIEIIHSHLYDLFGDHTKYWWESSRDEVNMLPMLTNCQALRLRGVGWEASRIDEFLSRSTCLEHFSFRGHGEPEIKLRETAKLLELDSLHFESNGGPMTRNILKHFNGREAGVMGDGITSADIIQFLNEWKSGERLRNLEVFVIATDFDYPTNWPSIEFKKLSTKVEFVRRYPDRLCFGFETDLYLVRETDGHVATVQLTLNRFYLAVWNMTEKEFLEKFHSA